MKNLGGSAGASEILKERAHQGFEGRQLDDHGILERYSAYYKYTCY